jgi:hypothetical protein
MNIKERMNRIKDRIKNMAWSLRLAAIFLLTCYIALLFWYTSLGVLLTFVFMLVVSIIRIIIYFDVGR